VDEDEWRLTAELDGAAEEIQRFAAELTGRLPAEASLTREGGTVRVYSHEEAAAARIEAIALALLDRTGLGYELWHDRWDEEETEWEEIAPDLPPGAEVPELEELRAVAPEPAEEEAGTGEAAGGLAHGPWERPAEDFPGAVRSLGDAGALVLVRFPDRDAGAELRARLVDAGIPLVSRRRGFGVPARDEAAATDLAARLRSEAPRGTSIETTTVPGRRPTG
jgi:hypothetical protein